MDSLLTNRWLDGTTSTPIYDEASISVARQDARRLAIDLGFDEAAAASIAIVVSELGHNQLRHARDGRIALRPIAREGIPGVEIVAIDRGEGIERPTEAIDGASTHPDGLGIGLSGAMRLSDEIDFDVRFGAGTCIRARKFVRRAPRRREVGLLSRACIGETIDGDDAFFRRTDDGLILAVADGLGHGPEAREASWRAMEMVSKDGMASRQALFDHVDETLRVTRGAVMAIVDVDERSGSMQHATVGNIVTHVASRASARSFTGGAMVLGARRATKRLRVTEEQAPIAPGDVIVVASDGLRSTTHLDDVSLQRHPIVIADHLMRRFARDGDDVTIVVAS